MAHRDLNILDSMIRNRTNRKAIEATGSPLPPPPGSNLAKFRIPTVNDIFGSGSISQAIVDKIPTANEILGSGSVSQAVVKGSADIGRSAVKKIGEILGLSSKEGADVGGGQPLNTTIDTGSPTQADAIERVVSPAVDTLIRPSNPSSESSVEPLPPIIPKDVQPAILGSVLGGTLGGTTGSIIGSNVGTNLGNIIDEGLTGTSTTGTKTSFPGLLGTPEGQAAAKDILKIIATSTPNVDNFTFQPTDLSNITNVSSLDIPSAVSTDIQLPNRVSGGLSLTPVTQPDIISPEGLSNISRISDNISVDTSLPRTSVDTSLPRTSVDTSLPRTSVGGLTNLDEFGNPVSVFSSELQNLLLSPEFGPRSEAENALINSLIEQVQGQSAVRGLEQASTESLAKSIAPTLLALQQQRIQNLTEAQRQDIANQLALREQDIQTGLTQRGQNLQRLLSEAQLGTTQRGQDIAALLDTANLGVQQRGQDIGALLDTANLGVQQRGQDIGALLDTANLGVQQRAQDITQRAQDITSLLDAANLGVQQRGQTLDTLLGQRGQDITAMLTQREQLINQRAQDIGALLDALGLDITQRAQTLETLLGGRAQNITQRGQDIQAALEMGDQTLEQLLRTRAQGVAQRQQDITQRLGNLDALLQLADLIQPQNVFIPKQEKQNLLETILGNTSISIPITV